MGAPEQLVDVSLGPVRVVAKGEDRREPLRLKNWEAVQRLAASGKPRVLASHLAQRMRASYDGGQVSRTNSQWSISHGNANRDIRHNLVTMRSRSRELERNDPYAKKFLELVEGNIVGATGISVQSRAVDLGPPPDYKYVQDKAANNLIELAWAANSRAGQFDVTGKLSRAAFERLLARTVARDGEVLVKHVTDPTSRCGIRYQMLESDWLDETYNVDLPNGNRIVMGVEIEASGRPIAYHLRTVHPGDTKRGTGDRVRYSADVLKHYFIADRPEQVRGVPWMHAAMSRLYQLGEFDDAAILAARLGADKFMLLEDAEGQAADWADSNTPESTDDARDGALFFNSQKGSIDILPRGTKVADWNPNYPSDAYGPFVLAALRGVATGFGVSYESVSGDRSSVTWTSIRHAVLDERDRWKALQSWMIDSYAWDTYGAWLDAALLSPKRPLAQLRAAQRDKYMAPVFAGRRWDWVNPKDDIEAKEKALNLKLTSHRRVLAEQGLDLEEVLAEIRDDAALAKSYGIDLNPPKPAPFQQAPAAPGADKGKPDDEADADADADQDQDQDPDKPKGATP
ncbi:MAG: phage portal protein [Thiobacillus sp.]|nr:phage portal protein [Thiobacillus sp.]